MIKQYSIKGRVQGVSFRRFVNKIAQDLKIKGFVQNEPDGSVTVVAQGSLKELSDFEHIFAQGNKFSRIDQILETEIKTNIPFKDFKIIKNKNIILDQVNSMKNLFRSLTKSSQTTEKPIKHIGIIPDGNRRWAKARGLKAYIGHKVGADFKRIQSFFDVCLKYDIRYFTMWVFSTENWSRPTKEVDYLLNLLLEKVVEGKEILMKGNVKFTWLGNKDKLSRKILENIRILEETTKDNTKLTFQFALNYGGRDEIVRAVNRAISSGVKRVTEKEFSNILNVNRIPDPDIIIRTGGEYRLSGFMAYQGIYSELFFVPTLFPDFSSGDLENIIKEYYSRSRRFGK